jgi:maltose/maltodextrin transport system permease protein
MPIVVSKSQKWRVFAAHAFLVGFLALTLFPLAIVISISLRPGNFASGSLIPDHISFEHWRLALGLSNVEADGTVVKPPFPVLHWLWNSVKVAGTAAALMVVLSTTAAYAFARMRFRAKTFTLNTIMLLQMFPPVLALVAIYTIFNVIGDHIPWLGIDSLPAVVLAYLGQISLHVWTIKGYFDTIPSEIEEAAHVDGATPFQAFRRVLLPMAVPILAVVFILAFVYSIIEYPIASVLLQSEDRLTLAVGSRLYLYEQRYLWGDFAAAAVLSGLPITAVFLLAQRWMVSGLTPKVAPALSPANAAPPTAPLAELFQPASVANTRSSGRDQKSIPGRISPATVSLPSTFVDEPLVSGLVTSTPPSTAMPVYLPIMYTGRAPIENHVLPSELSVVPLGLPFLLSNCSTKSAIIDSCGLSWNTARSTARNSQPPLGMVGSRPLDRFAAALKPNDAEISLKPPIIGVK